jgi:diguanylate cyclase (GGDEF)-like protein
MAAALGDGAALLEPLLAGMAGPEPSALQPPPTAAILSRAAAHRLVAETLGGRGEDARFGLLILDLDRFRAVNEALGAAAGDALLAATGTRLAQACGASAQVVRIEGDRYLALAETSRAELRTLARRVLATVAQPLTLGGRTVAVQASVGAVADAPGGATAADIMAQAESALRRAKLEGRNRFVLHEPRHEAAVAATSRLELDLAEAVGKGEMHLAYQPYVALDGGEVEGFEALLRWRHPTRGELKPASFIALAEATGQILPLGRWALIAALDRALRWPEAVALSVNISALQFHQPDFTSQVNAALAATGFPAERLELEITETVLMRDNPQTIGQLDALIGRGIRIALDDFGTGYSALAYLARLPHHRIKLDRSFVRDLGNPATAELIRAIIALARARGVATTAEGVETPEQVEEVRRMGFTHAQGFATGVPVFDPAAGIPEPLVQSAS